MSERVLLRAGAVAAILSAVVGGIATILHPQPSTDDPEAFLKVIAPAGYWILLHLLLFSSFLLALGGFIAIYYTLTRTQEPGITLARYGLAIVIVGTTLGAAWMSFDGIAMKHIANSWASAPLGQKETLFQISTAMESIIFAFFSITLITWFGLPFIFFGLSVATTDLYPRWLGWIAAASGTACVICGVIQAYSQRTAFVTHFLFPVFASIDSIWVLVMGVLLWRQVSAMDRVDVPAAPQPVRT